MRLAPESLSNLVEAADELSVWCADHHGPESVLVSYGTIGADGPLLVRVTKAGDVVVIPPGERAVSLEWFLKSQEQPA